MDLLRRIIVLRDLPRRREGSVQRVPWRSRQGCRAISWRDVETDIQHDQLLLASLDVLRTKIAQRVNPERTNQLLGLPTLGLIAQSTLVSGHRES